MSNHIIQPINLSQMTQDTHIQWIEVGKNDIGQEENWNLLQYHVKWFVGCARCLFGPIDEIHVGLVAVVGTWGREKRFARSDVIVVT